MEYRCISAYTFDYIILCANVHTYILYCIVQDGTSAGISRYKPLYLNVIYTTDTSAGVYS